jgi:hypothetical protein
MWNGNTGHVSGQVCSCWKWGNPVACLSPNWICSMGESGTFGDELPDVVTSEQEFALFKLESKLF